MLTKVRAFILLLRTFYRGEAGQGSKEPLPTPSTLILTPTATRFSAGGSTDLLKSACDELAAYGFKAADEGQEVAQNPTRREVLHLYAEDRIRCLWLGPFDAINNSGDALIQEAIDTPKARERKLESDLIRITAARNDTQRNIPAAQAPPRISIPVVLAGVTGFALAFGSSVYELPLVKGFDDESGQKALLLSLGIGAALGGLCVASLFGLTVHDENASAHWSPKPESHASQVIAGLVMIAAFGLIRTWAATGPRDWLVTLGLMGIDAAVLMYVKNEATRHRRRENLWAERCDGREQKKLLAESTEEQRASTEAELQRTKTERLAAEQKLESRLRHAFELEPAIHAGVSAIDEGYFLGIDKNNGRFSAGSGVAA